MNTRQPAQGRRRNDYVSFIFTLQSHTIRTCSVIKRTIKQPEKVKHSVAFRSLWVITFTQATRETLYTFQMLTVKETNFKASYECKTQFK